MKKNNTLIFKKSKRKVIEALKKGDIDYVAQSKWSFADKFFAFLIAIGFFSFAQETFPCPRMRKNIPLWILIGLMT